MIGLQWMTRWTLKQRLSASYMTFGIGHVPLKSCYGRPLYCLWSLVSIYGLVVSDVYSGVSMCEFS